MSRPRVLIVGRSGTTTTRLRAHLSRRGILVRGAPDCGAAMEALRPGVFDAAVLDVQGAGFAAVAFREMLQSDYRGMPVLELPADDAGPEDIGLLSAALEQEIRESDPRRILEDAISSKPDTMKRDTVKKERETPSTAPPGATVERASSSDEGSGREDSGASQGPSQDDGKA